MFEDMGTPMVRPESSTGNIVEQKASPNTKLPPDAPHARPVIAPRTSPVQSPTVPKAPSASIMPAPVKPSAPIVPAQAPLKMQPIIDPRDAQAPAVTKTQVLPPQKPVAAIPQHAEPTTSSAPSAPTIAPVKRDPSESAIKGPKTMPALPTEKVQTQEIFTPEAAAVETETIFERNQNRVAETAEKPAAPVVPVTTRSNVKPASFDKAEQGVLKRSVKFAQGQIGLSSAEIDPLAAGVSRELGTAGKEVWRVEIRAYATAYGTGVSSDKRIALSRALSLRTALISQGVPASRIDVMAEGASTNGGEPDRIDLYLYGPTAE